jgi:hypothetical protein
MLIHFLRCCFKKGHRLRSNIKLKYGVRMANQPYFYNKKCFSIGFAFAKASIQLNSEILQRRGTPIKEIVH